jgi:hypothetical protein
MARKFPAGHLPHPADLLRVSPRDKRHVGCGTIAECVSSFLQHKQIWEFL